MNLRKLTTLALILSLGLVLSAIEMLIPINFLPGVKIGLGNIATIVALLLYGLPEGLFVAVFRTLAVLLLGGSAMSFTLAVSGGVVATLVMFLLFRTAKKALSVTGVSIAGAIAHNVGQISAAMAITKSLGALAYLPILLVSGLVMGALTGFLANQLMRLLPGREPRRT
jgi:heptaprenyl diphosphate synthase